MSADLRVECDACGRLAPISTGQHECRECGAVCVNTPEFAEWLQHNFKPVPEEWKYPDLGTIGSSSSKSDIPGWLVACLVVLVGLVLLAVVSQSCADPATYWIEP